MAAGSDLVFAHVGFGPRAVPYLEGLALQRRLHERRCGNQIGDCCLLLEHEPVYTAGKRTAVTDRPVGEPGAPVIDVDRGGKITWHGPGQLVGYPIVRLPDPIDVVAYVRAIEQALIGACAEFGVGTGRVEGRSGVWVTGTARGTAGPGTAGRDAAAGPAAAAGPDRKVGAIGIRVARGVATHGFALNCDCDLSWYDRIVPCGIRDAQVTTLSAEAGRHISVSDVIPAVQRHLAAALGASAWRSVSGTDPILAPALSTARAGGTST